MITIEARDVISTASVRSLGGLKVIVRMYKPRHFHLLIFLRCVCFILITAVQVPNEGFEGTPV